jgi:GDP/UDP-N,N'-diacetylbacillosamine 2-epimerase (hydrolysing)
VKKLLFLTGSRGEWGYIRPLLQKCVAERDFEYSLCVTNMHLVPSFGLSVNEIISDGFEVKHRLHMSLDGYNNVTMAKSLSTLLASLVDVIASDPPDWIILAGDRGEQLMGAIVGAFCYIPIAHIQAGELSGNIDGMTRHAIGKYAHLHLASNSDACTRLTKLGEEEFRIHNIGAPQLDDLVDGRFSTIKEIFSNTGFDASQDFLLVVQHPVTGEFSEAEAQVSQVFSALNKFPQPKVVILPNNDAGSSAIRKGIETQRQGEYHVFANVKRSDYLGLLSTTICLVGNSSSGILEAPSFKVPVVNLGTRQNGRLRATNIIDEDFDTQKIIRAINKAMSDEFAATNLACCINPYGDGSSAAHAIQVIRDTPINDTLLNKALTY